MEKSTQEQTEGNGLRQAYGQGGQEGVERAKVFLESHKGQKPYQELYTDIKRHPVSADKLITKYFHAQYGNEVEVGKYGREKGLVAHVPACNHLYSVRFFPIISHDLVSLGNIIKPLEKYRKKGFLDSITLQLDNTFAGKVRENMRARKDFRLEEVGHDIIIVRYCQAKNLPLFCLGIDTVEYDSQLIKSKMQRLSLRSLIAIVNEQNLDFFSKHFSENTFAIA